MLILLLMMLAGRNYAELQCITNTECSCVNCDLTEIITDAKRYPSMTALNVNTTKITFLGKNSFNGLSKLEVLNLRNNSIEQVDILAFEGLENLKILDLSHNLIAELPPNIQLPSKQLEQLYLNDNRLTNLDINKLFKDLKTPLKVALSGNLWDCSCSLKDLSQWLNGSTVTLENEDSTLCATPKDMKNSTISTVWSLLDTLNCNSSLEHSSSSSTSMAYSTATSLFTVINESDSTAINGTSTTSNTGNSWRFLVGVLIAGLITLLLIIIAVKFPRWYDFVLSYNHHRLKEEEPYMFEEEFNVDYSMCTNDKSLEEETVVVFEQIHSFVPEEDGFIEDKYVDERDMRAES